VYDSITAMRAKGKTIMLVEQNAKAALDVADKAVLMEGGQVRIAGPAAELRGNSDIGRVYLGSRRAGRADPQGAPQSP
jgi:branched-chain amino acid transport system ATP-binding protein